MKLSVDESLSDAERLVLRAPSWSGPRTALVGLAVASAAVGGGLVWLGVEGRVPTWASLVAVGALCGAAALLGGALKPSRRVVELVFEHREGLMKLSGMGPGGARMGDLSYGEIDQFQLTRAGSAVQVTLRLQDGGFLPLTGPMTEREGKHLRDRLHQGVVRHGTTFGDSAFALPRHMVATEDSVSWRGREGALSRRSTLRVTEEGVVTPEGVVVPREGLTLRLHTPEGLPRPTLFLAGPQEASLLEDAARARRSQSPEPALQGIPAVAGDALDALDLLALRHWLHERLRA